MRKITFCSRSGAAMVEVIGAPTAEDILRVARYVPVIGRLNPTADGDRERSRVRAWLTDVVGPYTVTLVERAAYIGDDLEAMSGPQYDCELRHRALRTLDRFILELVEFQLESDARRGDSIDADTRVTRQRWANPQWREALGDYLLFHGNGRSADLDNWLDASDADGQPVHEWLRSWREYVALMQEVEA